MKHGFVYALSLVASGLLMQGCSRDGPDLNSIPSTFVGTLMVQPEGRLTSELYTSLVALSEAYGMTPQGDGATGGRQWQVQIYCGKQYVGGAATAGDGEVVLFDALIYGFKQAQDYERFKSDMLALMRRFGTVSRQEEKKPLERADLLKRGQHMGMDVTTQCSPKALQPASAVAP